MILGGTKKDSNNWKKVLLEIYRFAPSMWGESRKMGKYDPRHELAKRCGFENCELGNIIVFLEERKLVEMTSFDKDETHNWILTDKGFDVSLELEKQLREIEGKLRFENLQRWLIGLTAVLAISSLLNLIY